MTEIQRTDNSVAKLQELIPSGWLFYNNSAPDLTRLLIRLPNGYEVSVIQGTGTYGSPRSGLFEVAVFDINGNFTRAAFSEDPGDSILGWQTPGEVFAIAQRAAAL